MDTAPELPTVLSFCSGYAGIERGLDLAGVEHRVLAYVEIEAFAIANLVAKMESGALDPAPVYTDIKTFPAELFRGAVDIITGGYPCQPFSAAGKRRGSDDPRHLWPHIRDHIVTIQPDQCFFENVDGHVSLGLNSVISDLEESGYRTTWGIFSAAEVGAPHQRKRVYIMADRQRQGLSERQSKQGIHSKTRSSPKRENVILESVKRYAAPKRAAKPCLGEQADGTSGWLDGSWELGIERVTTDEADRIDRIRLLGNGVVPQTAAKAWTVLSEELACYS